MKNLSIFPIVRTFTSTKLEGPRVAVTGLGLVTCLGVGVEKSWSRLLDGFCGIKKLDKLYDSIPSRIAGTVDVAHQDFISWKHSKTSSSAKNRGIAFALEASREAIADSGLSFTTESIQNRSGVSIGTGIAGIDDLLQGDQLLRDHGMSKINPFFITRILNNIAAGHVSIDYGLKGPNLAFSTACSTGTHSVGEAFLAIKMGDADVMVCGGTEGSISTLTMSGFARAKALCTDSNDSPETSSRPFDSSRSGFVMSEGAGILVLERYDLAVARGAKIYGEIMGYGMSGDGYHITAPLPNGDGGYRCMKQALETAGVTPEYIGYVNPHATSTPLGDRAENMAIRKLFGEHACNLQVGAVKGSVGHALGGAGAIELAFAIKAVETSTIPPSININKMEPADEFVLNYVANKKQSWQYRHEGTGRLFGIKNSFGFGGCNVSIVFGSCE